MDSEGTKLNTQWQNSVEQLLKRWGEQASGLRLLHYNAFYKFRSKNIGITIPVIILQSLAGSASIGFNTLFPEDIQHYAQIIVGAVSLTTSILITINNFLQYAELKQAHKTAMISYGKLSRDIRTILSLTRCDRPPGGPYLDKCKHELDRLTEDSPIIPDDITKSFVKKYADKTFDKPDICNGIGEIFIEEEGNINSELFSSLLSSIGKITQEEEKTIQKEEGIELSEQTSDEKKVSENMINELLSDENLQKEGDKTDLEKIDVDK